MFAQNRIHTDIGKWTLLSCCIGVLGGLGITVFYEAVEWSSRLFLGLGAGYAPPVPLGEGTPVVGVIARHWMIPVITALGGLLSGWIVFHLAPEAMGHGADDVVIDSFHYKGGLIRARVTVAKVLAAAVTLGSGGSAGREGPSALVAAGISSILGRVFKLDDRDRRIIVAVGIGTGIGAILKVPLGGALLSTEILYMDGFEISVLIPSFISTLVSYTVFASFVGYKPIFGYENFHTAVGSLNLFYFLLLGIVCGLVGIIYPKIFYLTRNYFRSLRLPYWLKPTLGGLLVGIIGLFLPQVLGVGYGWLQIEMLYSSLPLMVLIVLIFAKIFATSLTIGSGGNGGVMSPGLFIGGMVGAAWWQVIHLVMGRVPSPPQGFIVAGMLALFGAVANAPVSVMIMVVEMTGSYELLVPAMLALALATVIVGHNNIYESQLPTPADSPVHRLDYYIPVLRETKVKDVMNTRPPYVTPETPLSETREIIFNKKVKGLLVVSSQSAEQLLGVITREDILQVPEDRRMQMKAGEVMSASSIVVQPSETLDKALTLMSNHDIGLLPVVASNKLVGVITRRAIVQRFTAALRYMGKDTAQWTEKFAQQKRYS